MAADVTFSDATADLNSTTLPNGDNAIFNYEGEGAQEGTVTGALTVGSLTVNENTNLSLTAAESGTNTLAASTINLNGTLTLNSADLLTTLASATFTGNGTLNLNYSSGTSAAPTAINTSLINRSFTGTLQISNGYYSITEADANTLGITTYAVSRSASNAAGARLDIAADQRFTHNLLLSGGYSNDNTAAKIGARTVISGSVTLAGYTVLNLIDATSEENAVVFEGNINANGFGLAVWNSNGAQAFQHLIIRNGTISNLGPIQLANGAIVDIYQNLSASNLSNSTLTYTRATNAGADGTLNIYGNLSGISNITCSNSGTINVYGDMTGVTELNKTGSGTVNIYGNIDGITTISSAGGDTLHIYSDYHGSGTLTKNGASRAYMHGTVSGLTKIYNNNNSALYFQGLLQVDGDLEFDVRPAGSNAQDRIFVQGGMTGNGTITKTYWSHLVFENEVQHTGVLDIQGGYAKLGASDQRAVSVHFSEIIIGNTTTTARDNNTGLYLNSSASSYEGRITLQRAVLHQYDTDGSKAELQHYLKEVVVNAGSFSEDSNADAAAKITSTYNGGLRIGTLTGSGDILLEKLQSAETEYALFIFENIENYNGSILWANTNTDKRSNLGLKFGSVSQNSASTLTLGTENDPLNATADSFSMSGEGTLIVYGDLTTTNSLSMLGNGTFTLHGNATVGSVFESIGGGTFTIDGHVDVAADFRTSGDGHVRIEEDLNVSGNMIIEGGDVHVSGNVQVSYLNMKDGELQVDGNVDASQGFHQLGGSLSIGQQLSVATAFWMTHSGDLSIDGGVRLADETYLYYGYEDAELIDFDSLGGLEAEGNLCIYTMDANYFTKEKLQAGINLGISENVDQEHIFAMGYARGEYELRLDESTRTWWLYADDTPNIDIFSTDGIWDENWMPEMPKRPLGDIPTVSAVSNEFYLSSDARYATHSMMGEAVWGQFNQYSTPRGANIFGGMINDTTSQVESNAWMDIVGGSYNIVAGGNYAQWVQNPIRRDFVGDTHIQLRTVSGQQSPSAMAVIGGNYQDADGSSFTGNSFISIGEGVTVTGAVVGGSVMAHRTNATFDGNSQIYIYTALQGYDGVPMGDDNHSQLVVGGNYLNNNATTNYNFTGDSSIIIDLGHRYGATRSAAAAEFGKLIVGGDHAYSLPTSWSSANAGALTHGGNASILISGAEGVAFTQQIIGGSSDNSGAVNLTLNGSTQVAIDSGTYEHVIVAGSVSGIEGRLNSMWTSSGSTAIAGGTQLLIAGGSFLGHETVNTVDGKTLSIGSVSLVGGNHAYAPNGGSYSISGEEGIRIAIQSGAFAGHIVGASVVEGGSSDLRFGSHTVSGKVQLTMQGGSVASSDAKIVGGYLFAMPTAQAADQVQLSIGGIDVSLGGSTVVNDVIGGSWTHGLDVEGATIEQGDISLSLGGSVTVQGDVYAGGIQGGATKLQSDSTTVEIGAGVRFAKADGSATIISGGYLSSKLVEEDAQWGTQQDAFDSFYADGDNASVVLGDRELVLTNGLDYGDHLANAWLLQFDKVTLQEGTYATVGALLSTDATGPITISGAGTIALHAEQLNVTDAEGNRRLNTSALAVQDGATLSILNSTSGKYVSHLVSVAVSGNSHLIIDAAQSVGGVNDAVLVNGLISVEESEFTLRFYGSADMQSRALIRHNSEVTTLAATTTPALALSDTTVHLDLRSLDTKLLTGEMITLLLAENWEASNITLSEESRVHLEKWFNGDVELISDDGYLQLRGRTVAGSTYHSSKALTVNGRTGAAMIDDMYTTVNPEWNDPSGDRAALLAALENHFVGKDYATADRAMAAAGGASIPVIGLALAGDLDRQLRAIRNRTTTMGLQSDYQYDDLPAWSFWLNAEGDYRKLKADETFSGYRSNSWGGTVGASAEVSPHSTVGFALTAMYSDVQSYGPDSLKGDMTTYYVSAFWRMKNDAWTHTLIATAGLASMDAHRTVDYGSGSYKTDASPNGYAVGLMYELGYSIALNEDATTCAQPVLNIAWKHAQFNGFTESGSDAGLDVNSVKHSTLVIGGGVRMQTIAGEESYNRASILEGRVLLKGYAGDRQASAEVGFIGADYKGEMKSRTLSAFGLEVGAGLSIPLDSDTLFFDVNVELRGSETNFNATVGYKVSF